MKARSAAQRQACRNGEAALAKISAVKEIRTFLNNGRERKMKNPYGIGDVVRLKSGGPKMTVTEASFDDSVAAHWFDSMAILHTGVFPVQALVSFEEDEER